MSPHVSPPTSLAGSPLNRDPSYVPKSFQLYHSNRPPPVQHLHPRRATLHLSGPLMEALSPPTPHYKFNLGFLLTPARQRSCFIALAAPVFGSTNVHASVTPVSRTSTLYRASGNPREREVVPPDVRHILDVCMPSSVWSIPHTVLIIGTSILQQPPDTVLSSPPTFTTCIVVYELHRDRPLPQLARAHLSEFHIYSATSHSYLKTMLNDLPERGIIPTDDAGPAPLGEFRFRSFSSLSTLCDSPRHGAIRTLQKPPTLELGPPPMRTRNAVRGPHRPTVHLSTFAVSSELPSGGIAASHKTPGLGRLA
ncbi:hypothetical protein EVG20_g2260 [Dentipellis fragilis]|uniref:Uncharacterized protein n=1 Tax=Dentipellis fragilis TaxID=205917 RepID=A0A4Y9Z792_9AGAM|nr:hypothetical protein EVG20_g2260 [Dentipellis fragilis]